MPHARVRGDLGPKRQQDVINKNNLIIRVVDDERELVGMEAQVERVEDATGQWNAEVRFQVLIVVPTKSRDTVSWPDAKPLKRRSEASRANGEVRIGMTMYRFVRAASDDRAAREDALRTAEDRRQGKREVHRQTIHG
jgi:hypothetical protein